MGTGNVNDEAPLLGSNVQFKPMGLFWNIVKSFAGAGTFALPWAIMNAGLWGGIIGVILVALLSNYTIRTLLKCGERVMEINSKKMNTNNNNDYFVIPPSYPEIGRTAFGELGGKIVSLFSALMCFGVCLAYFILIATNIIELLPKVFHINAEVIAIIFPICVFLSCLTDLTKLSYTSIAGSVALLIAMGAVCIYGIEKHLLVPVQDYPFLEWKTIPLFLGGAAFLFCDHVILMPLANSCGSYRRFPSVLNFAMIFVTVINLIFAGLSYAFWRKDTCGSVISNLDPSSPVGDIVRIGISLEVLASFPLVANAGFQALETGFYLESVKAFPHHNPADPHPFFSKNVFYYIFRGGIILALAVIASLVKNFGLLVSLVGSLTIASTGFVFPQLIYMKLYRGQLPKWDIIVQILVIIFGLGMTGLGTFQSIQQIIDTLLHKASSSC